MLNVKAKVICFFVLFMLISSGAFSAEGIQAGPLRIKPSIDVTITSDNNVLLEPDGEEDDDMFYSLNPKVLIEFPFEGSEFSLEYGINLRRYSDFDTEDADLQNIAFDGLVNVNSQLKCRIMDHYNELSSDTDEILGRVEYTRNVAEIKPSYQLNSNTLIEGRFTHRKYDYDNETLFGRTEYDFGGAVVYNMFDTWGILGEVIHGDVDIDGTENDASFNRFLVGARGNFTSKLMGEAKIGFESRSYDEEGREDTDLTYFSGTIIHQVASDMELQIGITRDIIESITYAGNAYTNMQGRAMLTKSFAERVTVILSGYYQNNVYENPLELGDGTFEDREDDIWQAEVGVEYELNRYTRLLANLEHKSNDSNFDENDYKYSRVTVGARLEY